MTDSCPDEDVDTALHNLGKRLEERPSLVTSGDNLGVWTSGTLAICALSTNGGDNSGVG